jgi:protein ImuB
MAVRVPPPCGSAADAAGERKLRSLAAWSYGLTSKVSLELPDGLLLEVQGSLKLFGGLAPIKRKLLDEIGKRRLPCNVCTAPTPLGAFWLARYENVDVLGFDTLRRRLGLLPVAATDWPEPVRVLLADIGIGRIGDCLRLPRDGLARRAGRECLEDLDKALGRRPDPRIECPAPESVRFQMDLAAESTSSIVLRRTVERLLEKLVEHLRKRQGQVGELRIDFHHRDRPATVQTLGLVEPVHEKDRFLRPLSVRLEYMSLPAPVRAVSLTAPAVTAMRIAAPGLFDGGGADGGRGAQASLVECLRGRLRAEDVHGLRPAAEHRPERAWIKQIDLLCSSAASRRAEDTSPWAHWRPLWLLPAPLPLADGIARFRLRGRPQPVSGPERIESGWWDEEDIRRDYYAAVTEAGEKVWIYRDCVTRAWYLHGIFA